MATRISAPEDQEDEAGQHHDAAGPDELHVRPLAEDEVADHEGHHELELLHRLDVRAHGHGVGGRAELGRDGGEGAERDEAPPVLADLAEVAAGPVDGERRDDRGAEEVAAYTMTVSSYVESVKQLELVM